MKKLKILIVLFLLVFNFVSSQDKQYKEKCFSDAYLNSVLQKTPDFQRTMDEVNRRIREKTSQPENGIITIPIVVNIVHFGESLGMGKNITDAKVYEQIQILNDTYSNSNSHSDGVDTQIRFCLAESDVFGNTKRGILRYHGIQNSYNIDDGNGGASFDDILIKQNRDLSFPSNNYLNIWVTDLGNTGTLGYATFPFPYPGNSVIEGVVVDYRNFGLTDAAGLDLGMTSVHEVGHWLGLYHTFKDKTCFESNCLTQGDMVCDTEPRTYHAWCPPMDPVDPNDPDECNNSLDYCQEAPRCDLPTENTNAVQNYMDYNFDGCVKFFTQGQKDRMRQMLLLYRSEIASDPSPLTECNAAMSGGDDVPQEGCTPNNLGDQLGYRIRYTGGNFGVDLDMDGNTLAVLDRSRDIIKIYEVEDCMVTEDGIISKYHIEDLNLYPANDPRVGIERVKVKDGRIFISGTYGSSTGSSNGIYFLLIYKKNSSGEWEVHDTLTTDAYRYGHSFIIHEDELVVSTHQGIIQYELVNDQYIQTQNIPDLFPNSVFARIVPFARSIAYNGQVLVASTYTESLGARNVTIFHKNPDGSWNLNQTHAISNNLRGAKLNLHDNGLLFVTGNNGFYPFTNYYKISVRSSGVGIFLRQSENQSMTNALNASWDFNTMSLASEDLLVIFKNGGGVSFNEITLENFQNISVPALVNYYPNNWLNPYYANNSSAFTNSVIEGGYGRSGAINGNYLVVGNSICQEVYIYQLDDILDGVDINYGAIQNVNICNTPNDNEQIEGLNIVIGDNCNVDIVNQTNNLIASESIKFQPGTKIRYSTSGLEKVFNAKVDPTAFLGNSDCSFTGGQYSRNANSIYTEIKDSSQPVLSHNDTKEKEDIVSVFPNPVSSVLKIKSSEHYIIGVSINTINSVNVLNKVINENSREVELNLETLRTGIYFLTINLEDGSFVTKKIIKK